MSNVTGFEDVCFYKHYFKIETGCPFYRLSLDHRLPQLHNFVMRCLDSWESTVDEPQTKFSKAKPEKRKKYGLSIEKFNWACNLYQVKPQDQLEAAAWCSIAAQACNDAPELAIKQMRLERWGKKS